MLVQETQLLLWNTAAKPGATVRLSIDLGVRVRRDGLDDAIQQTDQILDALVSDSAGTTVTRKRTKQQHRIVLLKFDEERAAQQFTQRLSDTLALRFGQPILVNAKLERI